MLTIFTWFWKQPDGRAKYTAQHVNIWADMMRRNLTIPHRLACVTAHPEGIDPSIAIITPPGDFEDVRIPTWGPSFPQCLRRISMFRPDAAEIFGERFVSMDMDCVIGNNLDDLFSRDEDFVMYRGTSGDRPYNGSMLMMTAGARPQVFTTFSAEGAAEAGKKYVGSDQAWISYVLGKGEATWGPEDGVFWFRSSYNVGPCKIMFFPGTPKPWQVATEATDRWVTEHYHRNSCGRALILGYSPNVWQEAEEALSKFQFDAYIASPEVAAQWPVDVLAIASDDQQAERLARIHGYEDYVFCGRTPEKVSL